MANDMITLGDYFDNFISDQVKSGRFSSANEVLRAALRVFEKEEKLKGELNAALEQGEQSGFVKEFNRDKFLDKIHKTHLSREV